eukprot:scaffold585794_cov47-Prasinocladus_malaysianus.AAC.1
MKSFTVLSTAFQNLSEDCIVLLLQLSHCRAEGYGGAVMIDNLRQTSATTVAIFYATTIQHSHAQVAGGGIVSTDRLDLSAPLPGTFLDQH